jgi:hypothetical protein
MTSRFNRAGEGSGCTRRVAALSTVSRGEERQTSNAPHGPPLVTHQPLHSASFGAVWSIYSQCYPMSGCCLAGLFGALASPSEQSGSSAQRTTT